MEKSNYDITKEFCKQYFSSLPNCCIAEIQKPMEGMMVQTKRKDKHNERTYLVSCKLDKLMNVAILDVYPGIIVKRCYREMFLEYVSRINIEKKMGTILVEDFGDVTMRATLPFRDIPISLNTFDYFHNLMILELEKDIESLDRVASGKLPYRRDVDELLRTFLEFNNVRTEVDTYYREKVKTSYLSDVYEETKRQEKAEADAKIGKELLDELEAEGKGENISMNDFIKEISESDAEDK